MEDEAVQDKYDADNVEHKPGHIAYLHEAIQFADCAANCLMTSSK